jgi:hypothetical protein
MSEFDRHAVEQALAGNLVLSVTEAEALYAERGDPAAFEALASAVNRAESDQRAAAEAADA